MRDRGGAGNCQDVRCAAQQPGECNLSQRRTVLSEDCITHPAAPTQSEAPFWSHRSRFLRFLLWSVFWRCEGLRARSVSELSRRARPEIVRRYTLVVSTALNKRPSTLSILTQQIPDVLAALFRRIDFGGFRKRFKQSVVRNA
jgi:hypothetical protein